MKQKINTKHITHSGVGMMSNFRSHMSDVKIKQRAPTTGPWTGAGSVGHLLPGPHRKNKEILLLIIRDVLF